MAYFVIRFSQLQKLCDVKDGVAEWLRRWFDTCATRVCPGMRLTASDFISLYVYLFIDPRGFLLDELNI